MAAQMRQRFRDLPDVDWDSFEDGEVATYDETTDTLTGETGGSGGGAPTGAAGGVLSGTYPNPGFAVDQATQAELDASTAAAVPKALVDAKGDLIVATAADTVARRAVGSNGQILTADSAETDGVKWAAPSGGPPTGAAGGVLADTYPNPSFAVDLATQEELNTHAALASHTNERTPVDGSVTAAKVNTALKPSGAAATTDESLRRLGTSASHAAAGDDARFPTTGQKNALAGTSGTPGTGNEYATKATTDALTSSVAAKQDASTAATDAEVTAAVATAVVKVPTTSARNVVQPTGGTGIVPLTVKGAELQAASLQSWQNSDAETLVEVVPGVGGSGTVNIFGSSSQISCLDADTSQAILYPGSVYCYAPDGAPTDPAVFVSAWSDTAARWQALAGGALQWGDGTAVDTEVSRVAANVLAAPSLELSEVTAPATPGANKGRLYFEDSGGVTRACVKFPSGNVVVIAEDF